MNKSLIDVLFASEKRKNMLLMLREGPVEMSSLLDSLNTNRQSLLPQAKMLEENHLVSKKDDTYELTTIGYLMVGRMEPLLGTLDVFGSDVDYWGTHNLGFIPPHLLERISEIESCTIVEPKVSNIFDLNRDFLEESMRSKSFSSFVSFLHPDYIQIFYNLFNGGVDSTFIMSDKLFEKLKLDHYDNFKKILLTRSINFFVYKKEMDLVSFSQNDHCLILRLLTKDNEYDSKQLVCRGPRAMKWGDDFFEYYKQQSIPITDI